jgi:hypothetical protein
MGLTKVNFGHEYLRELAKKYENIFWRLSGAYEVSTVSWKKPRPKISFNNPFKKKRLIVLYNLIRGGNARFLKTRLNSE